MLQLYAEGIEQPIQISGRGAGPLGSNDSIEFYGTGIDTPFSDARVYWLVQGTRPGKRIAALPSANSASSDNTQGFPFTVIREDRTTYFATLLNGEDKDNFFGARGYFRTRGPNSYRGEPRFQFGAAVSAGHHAARRHRGPGASRVGELQWRVHRRDEFSGQVNVTNNFPVDSSLLTEGANTVTLTALEGDNDVSVVQSIALHYPHTYVADQNWLRATAPAGSGVRIGGFSSPQIHVYDITDPLAVTQLAGAVRLDGSTYSVSAALRPGSPAEHTLLAFADGEISSPAALSLSRAEPFGSASRQCRFAVHHASGFRGQPRAFETLAGI